MDKVATDAFDDIVGLFAAHNDQAAIKRVYENLEATNPAAVRELHPLAEWFIALGLIDAGRPDDAKVAVTRALAMDPSDDIRQELQKLAAQLG